MQTVEDLKEIEHMPTISVLDIQSNRFNDVKIVDILEKMPNLKVLYLQVRSFGRVTQKLILETRGIR